MLEYLHVKNLALIEECEIDFTSGLNIFTGETGAGKSILLGSVNLCLGQRADKSMIRHGAKEALVELAFRADERTKARLEEMDLSTDDDTVLILRKITPDKSIFKINGETVLVKQVKEIAEGLIDIHGQHEHQSLLNNTKQRDLIDAFGGEEISKALSKVKECCSLYKDVSGKYEELRESSSDAKRQIDFLSFECEEISEANLIVGEDEELEENYKLMKSAGKICEGVAEAIAAISGDNSEDAGSFVSHAIHKMNQVASIDENVNSMLDKLSEAEALLGDFALEASRYLNTLSFDEENMAATEERLDKINTLKSKYGNSIEIILKKLDEKSEELELLKNLDENLEKLSKQTEEALKAYEEACDELSSLRETSAVEFSKMLKSDLLELNFEGVEFRVDIDKNDIISPNGRDNIEFMISTNPGEPLKPLKNVASGGELSRIMLAIKTIMAAKDSIDSLIFDEIDAGISGKTAWEVSKKLSRLSKDHQVIAITHLAQIAAMADTHFEIKKTVFNDSTKTTISRLDSDGEIEELSRLVGGGNITQSARSNAIELKNEAKKLK